jgi:hypothetical protein
LPITNNPLTQISREATASLLQRIEYFKPMQQGLLATIFESISPVINKQIQ